MLRTLVEFVGRPTPIKDMITYLKNPPPVLPAPRTPAECDCWQEILLEDFVLRTLMLRKINTLKTRETILRAIKGD